MIINLNDDIKMAQEIVSKKTLPKRHVFSDISGIYRTTNEEMAQKEYINAIKDKEKILSVVASGDQIINSILLGSKDIVGYDLSRFPKYYLMLKLAAIKTLTKEEYLSFFIGDIHNELFNYDIYTKIYPSLEKEYQMFWDSLFDYFDIIELSESMLFRTSIENKNIMINNNYYLQYNNYDILKEKINNINIDFIDGNIFEIINDEMVKYDLVNLSNIINYFNVKNKDYIEYKKFIEKTPLNENGTVLTYLINIHDYWEKYNILDQFNSEDYKKISFDENNNSDGLLLYKKKNYCKNLKKVL